MSNEAEKNPQQAGQPDPTGSANPSPGNQSQNNPPQDISKKTPSQDSDSRGQQKPQEDEKRRAS
jgi:hypothetical protein